MNLKSRLPGTIVISLIMLVGGSVGLYSGWKSWQEAKAGQPGEVTLTGCQAKAHTRRQLESLSNCELRSSTGNVQSIELNRELADRFLGKQVRASLFENGAFIVTEPRILARGFATSVFFFGLGFTFLLGLITVPQFRANLGSGSSLQQIDESTDLSSHRAHIPAALSAFATGLGLVLCSQNTYFYYGFFALVAICVFSYGKQRAKLAARAQARRTGPGGFSPPPVIKKVS